MDAQNGKKCIKISGVKCLDIPLTLDCGQSFRWTQNGKAFHGIASGRKVDVFTEDGNLYIIGDSDEKFWRRYFDLDRDYDEICSRFLSDKYLKAAVEAYSGIRILRQDSWEALCSFIISQNNNIPRIKGIIERLCRLCGDEIDGEYAFPSAQTLSLLTPDDLSEIRAGFRAKYIIDAAKKVSSGEVDLEKINGMTLDEARAALQKITGVGPKVAECTLLYGFGKIDAFPVDVWVKRIMSEMYENGLPECTDGVKGIAQQYLFHWRRNM